METITRVYHVYDYDELSEKAKERVKNWYINDEFRTDIFSDDCNLFLSENYPESELKVQYSLNYCQGDGLNIYGKLYLIDMLNKISYDNYTEKEKRFIHWLFTKYNKYFSVQLPENRHYCYCIVDQIDLEYDIISDLEYDRIRDINYGAIRKFQDNVIDHFKTLCSEYKSAGYKYFYDPDEEEIADTCSANDWKFTEDGEFFTL